MMSADLIQTLWIGPALGSMEQMCLTSFVRHGHRVRLFTYGPVKNVPSGVEVAAATEIPPWSAAFRTRDGGYANFADVFRYKLLAERGGWWVDCDVVCVRPWQVAQPTLAASTEEKDHGRIANVFVLRAPAGSELMRACFAAANALGEEKFIFAHTGPFLLNRLVREAHLEHILASPGRFAPVPWNAVQYFAVTRPFLRHVFHLKNLVRRRHLVPRFSSETIGVHLWSGMWAQAELDRDRPLPATSLYAQYRRQYAPSPAFAG
jgi:hypothetical protein